MSVKATPPLFPFDVDGGQVTIIYAAFYRHHFAPYERGFILTIAKKLEDATPRTIVMGATHDDEVYRWMTRAGIETSEAQRIVAAAHTVWKRYEAIAKPVHHHADADKQPATRP